MMDNERSCHNCRFHKTQDTGYSNYTTTGYNIECMFGKVAPVQFGDGSTEEEDVLAERLKVFAASCPHYSEGTGLFIDCDGEELDANVKDWIRINCK